MSKTDAEMIANYRARIKRQNEAIKKNYDRISVTLPKGTIDRIKALGLTINGVANNSILEYLNYAEEGARQPEPVHEEQKQGMPVADPERLKELQAIVDARKAEITGKKPQSDEEKEQERAETIAAAKFAEK